MELVTIRLGENRECWAIKTSDDDFADFLISLGYYPCHVSASTSPYYYFWLPFKALGILPKFDIMPLGYKNRHVDAIDITDMPQTWESVVELCERRNVPISELEAIWAEGFGVQSGHELGTNQIFCLMNNLAIPSEFRRIVEYLREAEIDEIINQRRERE